MVPRAAREDVARLKAWVETHGVDVLDCSPAHLRLLLDEGLGGSRPLRAELQALSILAARAFTGYGAGSS